MEYDFPNYIARTAILAAQSVTANVNTSVIDLSTYPGEVAIALNPGTNTAGTTPSVTVYGFHSTDNSNWTTCNVNSSALTAPASAALLTVDTRSANRYLKFACNIGGSASPAIPLGVEFIGQKKYNAT